MSIPLLCIGLLAFLGIGLGFAVSMTRAKTKTLIGHSTDPQDGLYKIIRAHGNTMEYVPLLALLIYILSLSSYSLWVLCCMVLVTVFRYVFVLGIILPKTLAKPNSLRFIGALGTYICSFGLIVAVLMLALNAY